MSNNVLVIGKVVTLAFWALVIVSMTTGVFSPTHARYLAVAGLVFLAAHALEVLVFRRLISAQSDSSVRVSLRVMLYGMFEIWGLKK